jgi:hypothetical protein
MLSGDSKSKINLAFIKQDDFFSIRGHGAELCEVIAQETQLRSSFIITLSVWNSQPI